MSMVVMHSKPIALLALACVLVASCSASDDAAPSPSDAAVTTTVDSPTEAPPPVDTAPPDTAADTTLPEEPTTTAEVPGPDEPAIDPDSIIIEDVAFPAGVTVESQQNSTGFTTDGSRIFTTVTIEGIAGRHIALIAPDGTDFQCITCADLASPDLDLRQPQVAADGRLIAVRNGSEEQRHAIVECTPSVVECDTAELIPVELPLGAVPLLRNAQMRITPAGDAVLFTHVRTDGLLIPVLGRLARADDRYTVSDARALAGFRPTLSGSADDLELAIGNWGEAKGFADGGASVVYYTTIDSLNYDSVKLDLETGVITRLTSHPEYDEDVDLSLDDRWLVQASYRNFERMSVFSLVPRPAIVDAMLRGPIALLRNQNERRFFDLFVLPVGEADRESDVAIQVVGPEGDDPEVNSRGTGRWSPDGTEFAFMDEVADELGVARLHVARFTSLEPSEPTPIVPTPIPTWAAPIDEVLSPVESVSGTLNGPASGSADIVFELDLSGSGAPSTIEITFIDYSSDGCSTLNGTEQATLSGLEYTWSADLVVTGCHEGSLLADMEGVALPASASGTVVAEYDGVRVEGIPQP